MYLFWFSKAREINGGMGFVCRLPLNSKETVLRIRMKKTAKED